MNLAVNSTCLVCCRLFALRQASRRAPLRPPADIKGQGRAGAAREVDKGGSSNVSLCPFINLGCKFVFHLKAKVKALDWPARRVVAARSG
ncbi:hypothetical protein E2C01_098373 [Portunus trituberculatus]|uniref:Uncharacterized protein n=1 Tax=Portunus trituberculatus TaxID=210409 RepID=A0A5B7KCQ7_PORTR|nr:hypothetical protein [Portunus trituberculatus]